MSFYFSDSNVIKEDKCEDPEEPVSHQQPSVMKREPVSVLSKLMDAKGQSDRKTGTSTGHLLSFRWFHSCVFTKVPNY